MGKFKMIYDQILATYTVGPFRRDVPADSTPRLETILAAHNATGAETADTRAFGPYVIRRLSHAVPQFPDRV